MGLVTTTEWAMLSVTTGHRLFLFIDKIHFLLVLSYNIGKRRWLIGGITMAENLTYTRCGDYYIPDIKLSYTEPIEWNRFSRRAHTHLKEHRPILYNDMILSEQLFPYLKRSAKRQCAAWSSLKLIYWEQIPHRTKRRSRWHGCSTWICWERKRRKSWWTNWFIANLVPTWDKVQSLGFRCNLRRSPFNFCPTWSEVIIPDKLARSYMKRYLVLWPGIAYFFAHGSTQ